MTLENHIIPGSQATEVPEKQPRRQYTADEKRRIVREAAACTEPGAITALLRNEGIYWSYL